MRTLRLSAIVAVLLAAWSGAAAWTAPKLWDVCNSAPRAGGSVTVNVDITGPERTDMAARLFYSLNNQASWQQVAMSAVGEPGYANTFTADITMPGSGVVYYYITADDGSNWATQSPFNGGNTWPPGTNALATIADEGTGDTVNNPDGPFLDLTGVWMGYSATHFYARLTNNDDEWPIRRGILGPWYLYAAGFRNPDAVQDTWVFAMAYGNVLGIYTPGLYQINSYTFDFEKFADIDYELDGNTLNMRCAIADIVANPRFGPWPIPSGYLRSAKGDTRSVDLGQNNYLHDTTNYARWYIHRTPKMTVGQNSAAVLDNPRVFPRAGDPEDSFRFQVRYTDVDTNLPLVRAVVVDGDTLDMTPSHHRYWDGPTFTRYQDGFAPGWHRFRFLFDDGMAAVTTATDSFEVIGTGVGELAGIEPSTFSASPNPFRDRVELNVPGGWNGLEIRDCFGRLVRRFAGRRNRWDGTDCNGKLLPAGIYFAGPARGTRIFRLVLAR